MQQHENVVNMSNIYYIVTQYMINTFKPLNLYFRKYCVLDVKRQIRYSCNYDFRDVTERTLNPAFCSPSRPCGHYVSIALSKSKDSGLWPRSIIMYAV
jgi:hypothetical protein